MKPTPQRTLTATVYAQKGSPFWWARVPTWDAATGQWGVVRQSTKVTDQTTAQAIADQWAALAKAAAPGEGPSVMSRDYALEVTNLILRLAGQPPVHQSRGWAEYAQEWLSLQSPDLSPRTLESYDSHIRRFSGFLGARGRDKPLNQITGADLTRFYQQSIEEGRKPKTVNNTIKCLQAIFERGRNEGLCTSNPVALIIRRHGSANVRDVLSVEDITALLRYLRSRSELAEDLTLFLLGLCTGQRHDDCAKCHRSHLDTAAHPWILWHLTTGKTAKKLEIPLVEPLNTHLRRLLKKAPASGADIASLYLMPTLAGLKVGGNKGLAQRFSDHLVEAGVTGTHIAATGKGRPFNSKTFHSLRHTCNSLLAAAGVPAEMRRKIIGHDSAKINEGYTHYDHQQQATALVAAFEKLGS